MSNEFLPGLEPPRKPTPNAKTAGPVESAVRSEIDHKRLAGVLDDSFSGWCALAIQTAFDIDNSAGIGRPSGRAMLYATLNDILANLPQPETVVTTELDKALEAIFNGPDVE